MNSVVRLIAGLSVFVVAWLLAESALAQSTNFVNFEGKQTSPIRLSPHGSLVTIPFVGENPRSLVVNSNATKVYVAFALSGNRTTLVPATQAPPQPPNPPGSTNSAPPQVGLIVDATDPAWTGVIKYTMPDNDIAEIDTSSLTVTRYFPRVGTVNFA